MICMDFLLKPFFIGYNSYCSLVVLKIMCWNHPLSRCFFLYQRAELSNGIHSDKYIDTLVHISFDFWFHLYSLDLGEIKKDELPGPEALVMPGIFLLRI